MTLEQIPGRQAQRALSELLDSVQEDGKHVAITRWGTTSGVLVPGKWHEQAMRAVAIVEGLISLGQADQGDLKKFVAALQATGNQEVAKAS